MPGGVEPRPVVYGTVERTDLWAPEKPDRPVEEFTVLTYHLAFRVSGLPAGLSLAAAIPLRLVADLDDWHQLDHYTAAFVVLAADGRPVALTLQQHNYLRTYLVGESVNSGPTDASTSTWPSDRTSFTPTFRDGRCDGRCGFWTMMPGPS